MTMRDVSGFVGMAALIGVLAMEGAASAQPACEPGHTFDPISQRCERVEVHRFNPETQTRSCQTGQVRIGTEQACCWSGQVFESGQCRGVPQSCPAGFHVSRESCQLDACTGGRVRAQDAVTCCFPGQVASQGRCRGIPTSCPATYDIDDDGETCSRARYEREQQQQQQAADRAAASARERERQREEAARQEAQAQQAERDRLEAERQYAEQLASPYYLRRQWMLGFILPIGVQHLRFDAYGTTNKGVGSRAGIELDRFIRFRGMRRLGTPPSVTLFGVDFRASAVVSVGVSDNTQPLAPDPGTALIAAPLRGELEARARIAVVAPLVFFRVRQTWLMLDDDPGDDRERTSVGARHMAVGFGLAMGSWGTRDGSINWDVSVRVAPAIDGAWRDVDVRARVSGAGSPLGIDVFASRVMNPGVYEDEMAVGFNLVVYPNLP